MKHKSIKKSLTVTKSKSKKNKTQKRFRKNQSGGGEDDYPSKDSFEFSDYIKEKHNDVYKELDYLRDRLLEIPNTRNLTSSQREDKMNIQDYIARVKAEKDTIYENEYKKYIDNLKANENKAAKAKEDANNRIKYKLSNKNQIYRI
jgi:hypothetical protein